MSEKIAYKHLAAFRRLAPMVTKNSEWNLVRLAELMGLQNAQAASDFLDKFDQQPATEPTLGDFKLFLGLVPAFETVPEFDADAINRLIATESAKATRKPDGAEHENKMKSEYDIRFAAQDIATRYRRYPGWDDNEA